MKLKQAIKSLLMKLPATLRAPIMRSNLNLPYEIDQNLTFKPATSDAELKQAFQILHDSYVEVGLMKPSATRMRITSYHKQMTSLILVAKYQNEVVGTVTLIRDNPKGLPGDQIYNLSSLRENGRILTEVSALAIKKEWRGQIFFPFMKYMIETMRHHFNTDTIIAIAHSQWSKFYEDILLFSPIATRTKDSYAFANNMQVSGSFLKLDEAYAVHSRVYARNRLNKNLFNFFWLHKFDHFQFIDEEFYSMINPCFQNTLICAEHSTSNNRNYRLTSLLKAKLGGNGNSLSAQVFNLSLQGLKLKLRQSENKATAPQEINSIVQLKIQLGPFCVSTISAQIIWQNPNQEMGLRILEADESWNEYFAYHGIGGAKISPLTQQNRKTIFTDNHKLTA